MIIPSQPINTGQSSQPVTVPAPIGGLNGRDPLAAMPPTDAYLMDNLFPGTAYVTSRKGCVKFTSSALAGPVQGLEVYAGGDGDKMLAFAGGKIYNVSVPVPSELYSGMNSSLPITAMFSNAADNAQHLIITTGLDQPCRFDGNSVTALTMTGMDGSQNTLNFVFAFKSRLYFGQRDKLGFYYLPVGQVQGALSYFDLGQVSFKGGYLVAIASFSDDTRKSPNDYIVFLTSKGELIVYQGYDPSNADTWQLVGRYYTAPPIGKKCTINYGTELVIITLEGAIPFSAIRRAGDMAAAGVIGADYVALTSKLGSYLQQYNINADVPGWGGLQYSGSGGWLILNVPISTSIAGGFVHFVMNTTTNAWCRYTNWNGLCFTVYNRRLYFGRLDGWVMLGDEGRLDDGEDIKVDIKQAYNNMENGDGRGPLQKHFQWVMLLISCDGEPPLSGRYNVDFFEEPPEYVNTLPNPEGAEWDVTLWDEGLWGDDGRTQRFLITLNRGGIYGALWLRAQLKGLTFTWYSSQFVLQETKGLLI